MLITVYICEILGLIILIHNFITVAIKMQYCIAYVVFKEKRAVIVPQEDGIFGYFYVLYSIFICAYTLL